MWRFLNRSFFVTFSKQVLIPVIEPSHHPLPPAKLSKHQKLTCPAVGAVGPRDRFRVALGAPCTLLWIETDETEKAKPKGKGCDMVLSAAVDGVIVLVFAILDFWDLYIYNISVRTRAMKGNRLDRVIVSSLPPMALALIMK